MTTFAKNQHLRCLLCTGNGKVPNSDKLKILLTADAKFDKHSVLIASIVH